MPEALRLVGREYCRHGKGMAAAGLEPGVFWAYYIGTLELVGGLLVAIGF